MEDSKKPSDKVTDVEEIPTFFDRINIHGKRAEDESQTEYHNRRRVVATLLTAYKSHGVQLWNTEFGQGLQRLALLTLNAGKSTQD